MKKRVHFWDNYKGILIFLVVFGHFIYDYANKMPGSMTRSVYVFIYTFHMPAFIFCSGFFSKSEHSRSKESLVRLLAYFLVFNTLMALFAFVCMGTGIKFLTPYYSYWYMLSLVWWRMLIKPISKVKGILVLSLAAALLIGYSGEFTNAFSVRRTIAFLPFFIAGYLLDKQKVEAFLERRKPWHMAVSLVVVALAAFGIYRLVGKLDLRGVMTMMGTYNANHSVVHRMLIMGIAVAAIVGMFFTVPNFEIPLLSKLGRNSLLVYLAHRFVTLVYYKKIFPFRNYNKWYPLFAVIASVITCVVFSDERLNRRVAAVFDKMTEAACDSKRSTKVLTAVVLLFLAMLCILALPKMVNWLLPGTVG